MIFDSVITDVKRAFFVYAKETKQLACDHQCSLDSLRTVREGRGHRTVEATCVKCDKTLQGNHGLALHCSWTK